MKKTHPENSLVVHVGRRIRELRLEQGISLRNFGNRSGVHPFHVMAIELGQVAANARTLRSIATALGVTSSDLLNHDVESDLGAILETMRLRPETIHVVHERVRILVQN